MHPARDIPHGTPDEGTREIVSGKPESRLLSRHSQCTIRITEASYETKIDEHKDVMFSWSEAKTHIGRFDISDNNNEDVGVK